MLDAKYSVVIPVYNSSKIISHTVSKVCKFFKSSGYKFELILVNDGSPDNSWEIISALAKSHKEIIAIDLLKNYGQHHANLCGFRESSGDYVITMDDDLQNPPEEIGKLISTVAQGYDLVLGSFDKKKHSFIRRIGSAVVGKLNRKVFGVKEKLTLTNFRIISRAVVDRVCRDSSYAPYVPGLVLKYSVSRANVLVHHSERAEGKSNYSWRKILRLVANILFNHSALPLRCGVTLGFFVSGFSLLLGSYFLLNAIFTGTHTPGWASIAVLLSFFNGTLILLLSIIGEYVLRIVRQMGTQSSYEVRSIVR